jgi:uncharacterized protein (TIGR00269 family)
MNCTRCPTSTKAVIGLARHNAAFCRDCFTGFVHEQVARAIKSQKMFSKDARILVAVSGGKDSLALWHILLELGYQADALYVDLGIGGYSSQSQQKVQRYAESVAAARGAKLLIHALEQEEGAGIKELSNILHRPTCSTCGTIKRYQFNRAAVEHEYDVMVTGHNLDDEAARLLGNVLHWQQEYLDKQGPSLPASVEGFAKKVKPLYRLTEREIAAYAVLNRIDYIVEECPMAKGSKMLLYKEVLNRLETESPGTKQRFYWGFLEQGSVGRKAVNSTAGSSMEETDQRRLQPCTSCGQPTTAGICSYCKMMVKAKAAAR